jgi:hypothetical protein
MCDVEEMSSDDMDDDDDCALSTPSNDELAPWGFDEFQDM